MGARWHCKLVGHIFIQYLYTLKKHRSAYFQRTDVKQHLLVNYLLKQGLYYTEIKSDKEQVLRLFYFC